MRPFAGTEERAHAALGTLVLIFGLLQVLAGMFRPDKVRPYFKRGTSQSLRVPSFASTLTFWMFFWQLRRLLQSFGPAV